MWQRSPALPAAAMVLLVWGGADALHLTGGAKADPVGDSASAITANAQSLTASAAQGVGLIAGGQRVSRFSRLVPRPAAPAKPAATSTAPRWPTLAATPAPAEIPGKTVAGTWIRPSAGAETSCFCMRWGEMHQGIDLAGPMGSPIVAVGDGVVIKAGPASGFGLWVVIQHSNGDVTVYGHMYHYYVTVGEHVHAGQHIADIGDNGESTGPHLHFGVRLGGDTGPYIDPVPWLKARGIDVGAYSPNA